MATIRIADSLTYGAKLFLFFLAVAVVGGGGMVVGAGLALPEAQAYLDGGTVGTTSLAGGAILGVLGAVVWFTGTFAVGYKLIGDAVAAGVRTGTDPTTTVSTTEEPSETGDELGPSPGEQAAEEHDADQTVPAAEEAAEPSPAQAPPEPEPRDAASQTGTDSQPPQDSGPTEPAEAAENPQVTEHREPPEDRPAAGRERTAEEIAFGSSSGPEREESETGEEPGPTEGRDAGADTRQPAEEPDEEFESTETLADEAETVETANDSSSDPLADFDDS